MSMDRRCPWCGWPSWLGTDLCRDCQGWLARDPYVSLRDRQRERRFVRHLARIAKRRARIPA